MVNHNRRRAFTCDFSLDADLLSSLESGRQGSLHRYRVAVCFDVRKDAWSGGHISGTASAASAKSGRTQPTNRPDGTDAVVLFRAVERNAILDAGQFLIALSQDGAASFKGHLEKETINRRDSYILEV